HEEDHLQEHGSRRNDYAPMAILLLLNQGGTTPSMHTGVLGTPRLSWAIHGPSTEILQNIWFTWHLKYEAV
ncbi:hypothetical protein FRC08_016546, partial [Ceratobasidium sp. 394]